MPATEQPVRRAKAPEDWRIEPLFEAQDSSKAESGRRRGGPLPPDLARRYGSDMTISLRGDRPTIVSNFVSTLDGVVAFDTEGRSGGREVSGAFGPDRFLMGLVRATADAVLVGAGTVRSGRAHVWTPGHVYPASTQAFAEWRRRLGLAAAQPTTVIVSASGDIDPAHPGLHAPDVPVLLVTTPDGAAHARVPALPSSVEIVVCGEGDRIDEGALLAALAERRLDLVVCEGGPRLLASLLGAGFVDELFLTLAPQLAGRSPDVGRLALVEGVAYDVADAPWAELASVMRTGDHLFLRYRLEQLPA